VNGEIVDSLWEEDFTTVEDSHIINDLKERLKALGLDPTQAEEIVKKSRNTGMIQRKPSEPFPIQPHKEWGEAKKRLDEQIKRTANILLNNSKLLPIGTEIPFKYTSLGLRAGNNYIAALMMVNREINEQLNKDRKDCTTIEFKKAIESLEKILQKLVRRLKKAQKTYDDQNS
jgi:hypothetical protein